MRFLLPLLAMALAPLAQGEKRTGLRVVELFTSQGCSSCPPADRLLTALTGQEGVLPLAFHVNYWNYLGWEDTLSSQFATLRQVAYRDNLGGQYVYTPQFVVGGSQEFGLRNTEQFLQSLEERFVPGVEMEWSDAGLILRPIDMGLAVGTVWVVQYLDETPTMIETGENAGNTYTYRHSVTDIRFLSSWRDEETVLDVEAPRDHGVAILISDATGRIHAAADWRLD